MRVKLFLAMVALASVLSACDRSASPQRQSSANEGKAAQSAAGGSANEGRAIGQAR